VAAGLLVAVLGGVVLAEPAQNVAALVQRQPDRIRAARGLVAAPGGIELFERLRPGPGEGHDLSPVHGALAGERYEARLLRTPPGQRRCPLGCPAEVGDLLAAFDHGAVHGAGEDRRDLTGGDTDHRLVEQGQALGHSSGVERQPALCAQPHGDEVRVPEAATVLTDYGRAFGRRGPLGGADVPEHLQDRTIATLDDVLPELVQDPFQPAFPPTRDGVLAGEGGGYRQQTRRARRTGRLICFGTNLEGPLHRLDAVVIPSGQPASGPQSHQVVGAEGVRVDVPPAGQRCGPVAPLIVRARPDQLFDKGHRAQPPRMRIATDFRGQAASRLLVSGVRRLAWASILRAM
jgi:hypothetical protein